VYALYVHRCPWEVQNAILWCCIKAAFGRFESILGLYNVVCY